MEADLRGFHHQTTQGESLRVAPGKRNNYCVHSEGLTFVITGAENRAEIISRGFLMLFKDELIISLRQSKVRRATGAPHREEPPSKGLQVKELCCMLQEGASKRTGLLRYRRLFSARKLLRAWRPARLVDVGDPVVAKEPKSTKGCFRISRHVWCYWFHEGPSQKTLSETRVLTFRTLLPSQPGRAHSWIIPHIFPSGNQSAPSELVTLVLERRVPRESNLQQTEVAR